MVKTKERNEKQVLTILKEEEHDGLRVERGPDRRLRLVLDCGTNNGSRWNPSNAGSIMAGEIHSFTSGSIREYPDEDYEI